MPDGNRTSMKWRFQINTANYKWIFTILRPKEKEQVLSSHSTKPPVQQDTNEITRLA